MAEELGGDPGATSAAGEDRVAQLEALVASLQKEKEGLPTEVAGASTNPPRRKSASRAKTAAAADATPTQSKKRKAKGDDEAADAKDLIVDDKQKQAAANKNPAGVRLANGNMENSLSVLAAYLGFRDTLRLKLWMEDEENLQEWVRQRGRMFGIPNARPNQSWERQHIFRMVATAEPKLQNATLPLEAKDGYKGVNFQNNSVGYASWAVTIMQLIKQHPKHFPDTAKAEVARTGAFASEDVNRGYCAVRAYWRIVYLRQEGKGRRFVNTKATPPSFLTDHDLRRLKNKVDATLATAVVKDSKEPALAETFTELRDQLLATQEKALEEGLDWAQSADVLSVVRADGEAMKGMNDAQREAYEKRVWQERAEQESTLWERQMTQLGTSNHGLVGKRVARPALTAAQLESFLKSQSRKLQGHVLHDEALIRQPEKAGDYIQQADVEQSLTVTMEAGSRSEAAVPDRFWKLQQSIATVSAPTPTYEQACEQLGLDPNAPKLDPQDPSDSALVLKPWQVTGAAWMAGNERSPLRGGLVADDCGLGKTILTLFHIYQRYLSLLADQAAGMEVVFRPTLIVCPAGLIDVWYAEWSSLFQGKLVLLQFYGQEKMYPADRRGFVVSSSTADLAQHLSEQYPPTNSDAARLVVLSSLTSWESRTLITMEKKEYEAKKGSKKGGKGKEKAASVDDDDELTGFQTVDELLTIDEGDTGSLSTALVYTNALRGYFARIVVDEGHNIKSTTTRMHRGVMTVEAEYHWLLTATPMINRVSDYHGYLAIFWRESWDHGVFGADVARSYEPAYWPEMPSTYQYWVADTPLFVLNPRSFARLANSGALTGFVARNVLQALLQCLQMRRTKATEITVGGVASRIGDSIPHYEIVTVELGMPRPTQRVYDGDYGFYADQLVRQKGGDGDGDDDEPRSAPQARAEAPVVTELGIRNNGMHRRLCLMTHDPHLEVFCSRARGHSMAKDIETYFHSCADDGMTTLFALSCPEIGMLPPIDRWSLGDWMALRSVKLQYICLYMHDVLFAHPFVSADGKFLSSSEAAEQGPPAPTERPPGPAPAPGRPPSPVTTPKKSTPVRRRVLFFTCWPAVLWQVFGFLRNLGIHVLALRPGMEAGELREAISTFNEPESEVDALVASITYATGLNLHRCCCEMVIVEVPGKINTTLQAIGRLHRIGQGRIQRVTILTVDHSYDQVLQAKATTKMLDQIAGEAAVREIGEPPEAVFADVVTAAEKDQAIAEWKNERVMSQAEEFVRQMLGQRRSRRQWGNILDLRAKDQLHYSGPETPRALKKHTQDLLELAPAKRRRLNDGPGLAGSAPAPPAASSPGAADEQMGGRDDEPPTPTPPAASRRLPAPPLSTRLGLVAKDPTLERATRLRDRLAAKKAHGDEIARVQAANRRKTAEYLQSKAEPLHPVQSDQTLVEDVASEDDRARSSSGSEDEGEEVGEDGEGEDDEGFAADVSGDVGEDGEADDQADEQADSDGESDGDGEGR